MSSWFENLRRLLFAHKSLGQRGEDAAVRFLRRLGYKIVARSARFNPRRRNSGEIDIVAVDGKQVVFVEVKTRSSHDKGHPAEAVDEEKQRRLTQAALSFLKRNDLLEYSSRFDVVAVTWPANVKRPTIEHYKNAFEAVGRGQMFS
ncbi:MAG: YraN family protein [Pirellulales bacterium]|nr:YraN family protein [Pirellulales bacterium]